jgi:hypothetical protein
MSTNNFDLSGLAQQALSGSPDDLSGLPDTAKFEAGTGNIADAVGFGAALEYLSKIGIEREPAQSGKSLPFFGKHGFQTFNFG